MTDTNTGGIAFNSPEARQKALQSKKTNLTYRQELFVSHYLANGCNATQSYLAVYGNKHTKNASKIAYNIMHNEKIEKEISKKIQDEVDKDSLLLKLVRIMNGENTTVSNQLRVIELIAKLMHYFDDKEEDNTVRIIISPELWNAGRNNDGYKNKLSTDAQAIDAEVVKPQIEEGNNAS